MPIDFPTSPATSQTYTFGGKTWRYNGSAWVLEGQAVAVASPNEKTRTINFIVDGGGSVVTAGSKGFVQIDFNANVVSWDIYSDVASSNVKIDVSKATYANFPTFTNSGGTSPILSTAQKNANTTIDWTNFTSFTAGDIIQFSVNATPTPANATRVTVALQIVTTP